jgi:hypothetical protein
MKGSQKQKSVVVSLTFNDNNYQFSTELAKPVETFYNEVCSFLKLDPKQYTLKYNSKQISSLRSSNLTISEIIEQNPNSNFKIIPRKTKTMNVRYQTLETNESNNLNKINNNFNSTTKNIKNLMTIQEKKNFNENYKDNISAIITNFPSVKEVEKIMEDFNINNIHFPNKKGLITNLGNDSLRVDFNNEAYLNEFISFVSFIKYENPHFKSLKIKKDYTNIKKNRKGISNMNIPHIMQNNNFNKKYNYNPLSKSAAKPLRSKLKLKIKIDDVIKALKYNEVDKDTYHGLRLKRDDEDEIVTDYYQQQNFLRNSSPYITEHEKHVLEEKENKKHFLYNKNFLTSVGKYSMKPNYIPNYVGLTPGENPKNHEFREVDKNKWINKKGFNA